MITKTELSVLKVMASKDIEWNWLVLDRILAVRQIPGYSNVVNIVNRLAKEGLVDIVTDEATSKSRYHVTQKGIGVAKEELA